MTLTVAAIQMYAVPFAVPRNLSHARALVEAAVAQGAKLVLLPEMFNTGYSYSTDMFDYAEPLDGLTANWLRDGAHKLDCCLGGGILERSGGDVYSTLLLATPDGQCVSYRKRHPFFWERSICRAGDAPQVIQTAWGRIGLLMGADIAYDDSANAYAGQVDLIVLSSTAALLPDGAVSLPDGRSMRMGQFHPAFDGRAAQMRYDYYGGVSRRAATQRVPIVHAVQCGTFQSPLPMERVGLLYTLLHQPRQLSLLLGHGRASVSAPFLGHSAIFAGDGRTLAAQPDDEGIVLAHIEPGVTSTVEMRHYPLNTQPVDGCQSDGWLRMYGPTIKNDGGYGFWDKADVRHEAVERVLDGMDEGRAERYRGRNYVNNDYV